MLAQLVNFAIVVAVLWWFALKPLVAKMKERNKEIDKGLEDAKQAEERLERVEKEVNERIKESKFDAQVIMAEAGKESEENRQKQLAKTKKEIEDMAAKAKELIQREKESMVGEARKEVGSIVVEALGKILSEKLSKDIDREYVEKVLKELK